MRKFAELVAIGRVVKPQGRRGEFVVEPLSDRPDRFPSLRRAYVPAPDGGSREVSVVSCWPHKGRFVVRLDGVDSIDAAEAYRGLELRIGEEELAPLAAGEYYHHQLLGLAVVDGGRELGTVADLMETGATPVLVVRGPAGEILVPFAESFLRKVDLVGKRIEIEMPGSTEADNRGIGVAGR